MTLSERQRSVIIAAMKLGYAALCIVGFRYLPPDWRGPVAIAAVIGFYVIFFVLGATSAFNGTATRNAQSPSGYRALNPDGEPGRDDQAR